ncbi:MAG TPA: BatD family protein [Patescibacteria group bacterium]|nr:BatD family protein [Patescibacteria group bacterium]
MKTVRIFLIAFLISLTAAGAYAQTTTIKAQVDKLALAADEPLTYKLTVASLAKNVPGPQLPRFDNFYIVSQARASTISVEAGKLRSTLSYTCVLIPKEAGKFKIEPSRIKIDGKVFSSEGFTIEVKPASSKPKSAAPPEEAPAVPEHAPSESEKVAL